MKLPITAILIQIMIIFPRSALQIRLDVCCCSHRTPPTSINVFVCERSFWNLVDRFCNGIFALIGGFGAPVFKHHTNLSAMWLMWHTTKLEYIESNNNNSVAIHTWVYINRAMSKSIGHGEQCIIIIISNNFLFSERLSFFPSCHILISWSGLHIILDIEALFYRHNGNRDACMDMCAVRFSQKKIRVGRPESYGTIDGCNRSNTRALKL